MPEHVLRDSSRIGAMRGAWLVANLIILSYSRRAFAADVLPGGEPVPVATIFVQLRSDDSRVRIERVIEGQSPQLLCQAPCSQSLDRRGVYVITGNGIPKTSPFTLPAAANELTLTVYPGSRARFWGGIGLLVGGGAIATAGWLFTPHPADSNDKSVSQSPVPLFVALVGVAVGVLGMALIDDAGTRVASSTGRWFSGLSSPPKRGNVKTSTLAVILRELGI